MKILGIDLAYNKSGWAVVEGGQLIRSGVVSAYQYRRGEKITSSVRCERSCGVIQDFKELLQSCTGDVVVAFEDPKNFLTSKMVNRGNGRATNIGTAISFGAAQERLYYAVGCAHGGVCNVVSLLPITPQAWQHWLRKIEPKSVPWAKTLWEKYRELGMLTPKRRVKLNMRITLASIVANGGYTWTVDQAEEESPFLGGVIYRKRWRFNISDDEIDAVGISLYAEWKYKKGGCPVYG